jgi:hypothetical protein
VGDSAKFGGIGPQSDKHRGDAEVASDFVDGAQLPSLPDVKTLDQLIDMVTMCMHLVSNQHTAVNHLQQYYQTFVPNKPAALYTPLPTTLEAIQKIIEADVIAALPIIQPKDWLMQAQLPYLTRFFDVPKTAVGFTQFSYIRPRCSRVISRHSLITGL